MVFTRAVVGNNGKPFALSQNNYRRKELEAKCDQCIATMGSTCSATADQFAILERPLPEDRSKRWPLDTNAHSTRQIANFAAWKARIRGNYAARGGIESDSEKRTLALRLNAGLTSAFIPTHHRLGMAIRLATST